MAEDEKKLEQEQDEKPMSFMTLVIITGLVGGILWSTIGYLGYIFNFTDIRPNVVLEPWALGDWKTKWQGTVISILLIGGFSIIAALIYYGLLRKIRGMYAGMAYGLAIFLIVFIVLNPLFPGMKPIQDLSRNTLITSICLYILYGTFIGYTISYEEKEQQYRKSREREVSQA